VLKFMAEKPEAVLAGEAGKRAATPAGASTAPVVASGSGR
jgi:cytochrome d ubiquinol oxidase subunit I